MTDLEQAVLRHLLGAPFRAVRQLDQIHAAVRSTGVETTVTGIIDTLASLKRRGAVVVNRNGNVMVSYDVTTRGCALAREMGMLEVTSV